MSMKSEITKRRVTKRAKSSVTKCKRKQTKRFMEAAMDEPIEASAATESMEEAMPNACATPNAAEPDGEGKGEREIASDGEKSQRQCWICYGDEEDSNDWLSPCRCTGSLKWAHQQCLLTWVNEMEVKCRDIMCPQCLYPYRFTGGPWFIEQHMKRFFESVNDLVEFLEMLTVLALKTNFVKCYLWYALIVMYTMKMMVQSKNDDVVPLSAIQPAPFLISAIVGLTRVKPVYKRFPARDFGIGRDNPHMDEATFFTTYGIILGCSMAALVSATATELRHRVGILYVPYIVFTFFVLTRIFLYFYKRDIQPRFVLNYGEEPQGKRGLLSLY